MADEHKPALLRMPSEPEPGARDSTTPFGDGRDGAPPWRSAAWISASAAVMLLLPRQYFAAAFSALLAGLFALIHRYRR